MQSTSAGELVTVTDGGPGLDGIVFDTPSRTKVVVAAGRSQAGHGRGTAHRPTGR